MKEIRTAVGERTAASPAAGDLWEGGPMPGSSELVDLAGADMNSPVLVAVLNNRRDFELAQRDGWYRIPLKRAPRRVAAEYLAFYQTKAFGDDAWAVNYVAPVRRFHLVLRAELLPNEADHPRAAEAYYKVELGTLQRLPQPIPSRRLRRVTFIPTTLGRLLAAQEINDLWWRDDPQQRLWAALREAGLLVECRYQVGEPLGETEIDFAIFCRDGKIAVLCDDGRVDEGTLRERRPTIYGLTVAGWHVLRFGIGELEEALLACVGKVLALVQRLGGQG